VETNRCLNLKEGEEKVGDTRQKRAEKVSNEVELLNAVEDINASLISVRKSLTSGPASSMTPFFSAGFLSFGQRRDKMFFHLLYI
jgi:hypothetical protein